MHSAMFNKKRLIVVMENQKTHYLFTELIQLEEAFIAMLLKSVDVSGQS